MAELWLAVHNGETLRLFEVTDTSYSQIGYLIELLLEEEKEVLQAAFNTGMNPGEATMKLFSTLTMKRAREILSHF